MVATEFRPGSAPEPARGPLRSGRAATVAAVVAWVLVVLAANRTGEWLLEQGYRTRILAPPLIGRYRWTSDRPLDAKALVPVAVALALLWIVPRLAQRSSWRALLAASAAGAVVWAVALALTDGWYWIERPMLLPGHYVEGVADVGSAGEFLRTFTDRISEYGVHVRGHPPGMVLLLWALDRIGLGGGVPAAWLVILAGGATVPAVLVTVREVADEDVARRAAPFLVLAPFALYVATTADALFACVGSWGIAAVVLATGRRDRTGDGLAVVGGVLFGAVAMLSYGLVLLAVAPLVVATARRRLRPLLLAGAGGAAFLLAWLLAGFWWVEGLLATRVEYLESVSTERPYVAFLLINLAGFALVTGPAVAAGIVRLRDRRLWMVVGSGVAMVALAGVSGLSKGEVERIWLPFAFWVVPATAALVGPGRAVPRGWLAVQAGAALAVQFGVRSHW